MKFLVFLLLGMISYNQAYSQIACVDLSGTYLVEKAKAVNPDCAPKRVSTKVWYKLEQKNCSTLLWTTVYKLREGNFCENDAVQYHIDGSNRSTPDYFYTWEAGEQKHTVTLTSAKIGTTSIYTRYLDKDGNLVSALFDNPRNAKVYPRSLIQ